MLLGEERGYNFRPDSLPHGNMLFLVTWDVELCASCALRPALFEREIASLGQVVRQHIARTEIPETPSLVTSRQSPGTGETSCQGGRLGS